MPKPLRYYFHNARLEDDDEEEKLPLGIFRVAPTKEDARDMAEYGELPVEKLRTALKELPSANPEFSQKGTLRRAVMEKEIADEKLAKEKADEERLRVSVAGRDIPVSGPMAKKLRSDLYEQVGSAQLDDLTRAKFGFGAQKKTKEQSEAEKLGRGAFSITVDPAGKQVGAETQRPIQRLVEKLPGGKRKSEALGAPLEALAELSDIPDRGTFHSRLERRPHIAISPGEAAGIAAEVVAPTALELGAKAAVPGIGLGAMGLGMAERATRIARLVSKAEKLRALGNIEEAAKLEKKVQEYMAVARLADEEIVKATRPSLPETVRDTGDRVLHEKTLDEARADPETFFGKLVEPEELPYKRTEADVRKLLSDVYEGKAAPEDPLEAIQARHAAEDAGRAKAAAAREARMRTGRGFLDEFHEDIVPRGTAEEIRLADERAALRNSVLGGIDEADAKRAAAKAKVLGTTRGFMESIHGDIVPEGLAAELKATEAEKKAALLAREPSRATLAEQIRASLSGGRGEPNYPKGRYAQTADKFLRHEMPGKRFIPEGPDSPPVMMANAGRAVAHDTIKIGNAGTEELRAAQDQLELLSKKQREALEPQIVHALNTGEGRPEILELAKPWRAFFNDRRREMIMASAAHFGFEPADLLDTDKNLADAINVLKKNGIEEPHYRENYFPHMNDRFNAAVQTSRGKGKSSFEDGVRELRQLYAERKQFDDTFEIPTDDQLRNILLEVNSVKDDMGVGIAFSPMKSLAPNLELGRKYDVPGFIGDPLMGNYKPGDLMKAARSYNEQTAFRIADILHFGPRGEKAGEWIKGVSQEPSGKAEAYMTEFRRRILRTLSGDPLLANEAPALSFIRSYEAANKLGKMALANVLQPTISAWEKAFQATSTTKALKNIMGSIPLQFSELIHVGKPSEMEQWAYRIGAVYDDVLNDMTAMSRGAHGKMSRLASWNLKWGGGRRTEKVNNIIGAHMGKVWAEGLAETIGSGKPGIWGLKTDTAANAEHAVRDMLEAHPAEADEFIRAARAGEKPREDLLDLMAYENTRSVNFRGDPTMVPLAWSSPWGKTITQFKNFGFNYGRFVKEDIVGYGLRTGDLRPAIALAGAGLLSGEAIKLMKTIVRADVSREDIQNIMEADYEDLKGDDNWNRLAVLTDAAVWSGTLALYGDAMQTLFSDRKDRALSMMVGPGISDPVNRFYEAREQGPISTATAMLPFGTPKDAAVQVMRSGRLPDLPELFEDDDAGSFILNQRKKR